MKKTLAVVLCGLCFALPAYPKKIAVLTEVNMPEALCVDDSQYYITEGASIWIYSLKDHKLVGKFGEAGEGPRAFKKTIAGFGLRLISMPDRLLVNSTDKVSFFRKNGEFIREMKTPISGYPAFYQPIGKKFVGLAMRIGADQSRVVTVNLFSEKLEKEKEIYCKAVLLHGSMQFPTPSTLFETRNNKIFIGGEEEFVIRILDMEGNPLSSIKRDCKKVKVTQKYKNGLFEAFEKDTRTKGMADYLKRMVQFKEYFPAIQFFLIDNDKIYISTYRRQMENNELFVYNTDGKFIKQLNFPLHYIDVLKPYPYTIKNGILYQLIENVENEVWELHASEIK